MLVRTILNDSLVGFWEPAKYVARLRETAFDYAWILGMVGRGEAKPAPQARRL